MPLRRSMVGFLELPRELRAISRRIPSSERAQDDCAYKCERDKNRQNIQLHS